MNAILKFQSQMESERFFTDVDFDVPPLHGKIRRTHLSRQLWCLRRYCLVCAKNGLLGWPNWVDIETGNRAPDFTVHWADGSCTGLEVTEITTSKVSSMRRNPRAVGSTATGWTVEEAERKIAKRFRLRVREKLIKLGKGIWTQADGYEVLGYENGEFVLSNKQSIVDQLVLRTRSLEMPKSVKVPIRYSLLFPGGHQLAYDIGGTPRLLQATIPKAKSVIGVVDPAP